MDGKLRLDIITSIYLVSVMSATSQRLHNFLNILAINFRLRVTLLLINLLLYILYN